MPLLYLPADALIVRNIYIDMICCETYAIYNALSFTIVHVDQGYRKPQYSAFQVQETN